MTTPAYLQSKVAGGGEICLLGTNVTKPLGLITPAPGVEAVHGLKVVDGEKEWLVTSANVQLVNVERIPGRCEACLPAKAVRQQLWEHSVLFESSENLMQETGLCTEEPVLLPDAYRHYWLQISNPTPNVIQPSASRCSC